MWQASIASISNKQKESHVAFPGKGVTQIFPTLRNSQEIFLTNVLTHFGNRFEVLLFGYALSVYNFLPFHAIFFFHSIGNTTPF